MRKSAKRTAAAGLGLLVALAMLELSLRLVGGFEAWYRRRAVHTSLNGARRTTILCEGNSFTLGIGAPPEQSFPAQLQRLLDARYGRDRFLVVNDGVNNQNSTELVAQLPATLERYQPDIVAFMMGQPDIWNKDGVAKFLDGHSRGSTAPERLYDLLYSLKSFRLLTLLVQGPDEVFNRLSFSLAFPEQPLADERLLGLKWMGALEDASLFDPALLSEPLAEEGRKALARLCELDTEDPLPPLLLAKLELAHDRDYYSAIGHYEESSRRSNGFNMDSYRDLRRLANFKFTEPLRTRVAGLLGRLEARRPPLKTMTAWETFYTTQTRPGFEEALSYGRLSASGSRACIRAYGALVASGRQDEAIDFFSGCLLRDPFWPAFGATINQVLSLETEGPKTRARVAAFRDSFVERYPGERARIDGRPSLEDWLRQDLRTALDLVRKQGARSVLQTYPPQREGGHRLPWFPDAVAREVAGERRIPVSDNYGALLRLFTSEDVAEEYYSVNGTHDMHLGAKGNGIIAQTLLGTLSGSGLLPGR